MHQSRLVILSDLSLCSLSDSEDTRLSNSSACPGATRLQNIFLNAAFASLYFLLWYRNDASDISLTGLCIWNLLGLTFSVLKPIHIFFKQCFFEKRTRLTCSGHKCLCSNEYVLWPIRME